jgi:multidrug resistance efflux pump
MPNLTTNAADIDLNERQDISQMIGNPPSWLLNYGISAIAWVVVLLLALSYFIKYPDVVTAKVMLTTENPPIRMLAKTGGRVSHLLVKNNETVEAGQLLAVMENTANWQDVLKLEAQLSPQPPQGELRAKSPFGGRGLKLGSLQNSYSTYTQNFKDYLFFLNQNGVLAKINHLIKQIESLKQLNNNLLRQKDIQLREFELSGKELQRQKQLNTEGVVSDSEFEKFSAAYLQQKRQIEANEVGFINNEMQIKQNEAQITDLQQGKKDNQNTKELTHQEDTRRLKSAIEEWKQAYLVTAPISGKVSMAKIWSPQQAIGSGDEIFAVVPLENTDGTSRGNREVGKKVLAKAVLPLANSGKVKTGLKSNIRLDGYPYQQYGILEGRVENMSLLPQAGKDGDTYLLELSVNDSLTTTYGKQLALKQEMQGTSNIITEDRRVIARLFDRLQDLLKNRE